MHERVPKRYDNAAARSTEPARASHDRNPGGFALPAQSFARLPIQRQSSDEEEEDLTESSESDEDALIKRFAYESEDLSDEDLSDDDNPKVKLIRAKGKKNVPNRSLNPVKAVKRVGRTLRHFRRRAGLRKALQKGRATKAELKRNAQETSAFYEEHRDLKSNVVTFPTGGKAELQPTLRRHDVGAYPMRKSGTQQTFVRGKAKPYAPLGKDLDKLVDEHKNLTHKKVRRDLSRGLRGKKPRYTPKSGYPVLEESQAVLMTDMARASRGVHNVNEMLNSSTGTFKQVFGKKSKEYPPAQSGGSKWLQEDTLKRKAQREESGSDDMSDSDDSDDEQPLKKARGYESDED